MLLALAAAPAMGQEEVSVTVYKKVSPSIALLKCRQGLGSGFAINEEGLVLTNAHVVSSPLPYQMRIDVMKSDGTIVPMIFKKVKILGVHPKFDLALVKVDAPAAGVKLIPVSLSRAGLIPGQTVYAIGNPGGNDDEVGAFQKTFTEGKVSGNQVIESVSYVQHSAAINRGNSGGPLCNMKGEIVGVNTLGRPDLQGIFFALPVDKFNDKEFVEPAKRQANPEKVKAILDAADKMQDQLKQARQVLSPDSEQLDGMRYYLLHLYHMALSHDPGSKELYIKIGSLFAQIEEPEHAVSYLARGISLDPWYSHSAYMDFGQSLGKINKYDLARLAFTEALAKFPRESDQTAVDLAKYSAKQKQWSDAAYYAKLAIAIGVIPRQEDELTKIYDDAIGKLGGDADKTKERCTKASDDLKDIKSAAAAAKSNKQRFLNSKFEDFVTNFDVMDATSDTLVTELWGKEHNSQIATEGGAVTATNPTTPTTPSTPTTPTASGDPSKEILAGIDTAKEQVRSRDKAKAVETLKALVAKYPDHAETKKAKDLLAIWDKPEAAPVKPVKDPTADLIQRKIDLAKIFKRSNQTDKAIETLEKVISDNPSHPLTDAARALLKDYQK
ncbi:MAG: S1C family serine protease [Phycisphaeraceae bacterium]